MKADPKWESEVGIPKYNRRTYAVLRKVKHPRHGDDPVALKKDQNKFLRNLHILRASISEIIEDGWLAEANLGNLTFIQMNLLKFIGVTRPAGASEEQNYWSIGDVATQLSVSYAAASKAVSRLVKEGLVESVIDPSDRRARQVRATRKGKRALASFASISDTRGAALCDPAGDTTVRRWNKNLEEMITALIESDDIGVVTCLKCGVYDQTGCIAEKFGAVCQIREALNDDA